jgi:hypothetical protein
MEKFLKRDFKLVINYKITSPNQGRPEYHFFHFQRQPGSPVALIPVTNKNLGRTHILANKNQYKVTREPSFRHESPWRLEEVAINAPKKFGHPQQNRATNCFYLRIFLTKD